MRLPNFILNKIKANQFIYTTHFRKKQSARNLTNIDVKKALVKGQVIEKLYRYGIGEKYLVYCKNKNQVFHIVLIYKNNKLLLKTIYIPDKRFKDDKKTRVDGEL